MNKEDSDKIMEALSNVMLKITVLENILIKNNIISQEAYAKEFKEVIDKTIEIVKQNADTDK
jgi:hypothetical protein